MTIDITKKDRKWRKICGVLFFFCIIGLIGALVYIVLENNKVEDTKSTTTLKPGKSTTPRTTPKPPTPEPGTMFNSFWDEYKEAAVASETYECSQVGVDILKKKGSAVDAAIATLLCACSTNFHSCGIGGGFFMTLYNRSEEQVTTLMARESAPGAATEGMYINDTTKSSVHGGKAIGVPTEVKGYWEAWKRYGKLPWRDLFTPTIDLCENGFTVSWHLQYAIDQTEKNVQPGLRALMTKADGTLYRRGDTIKRPVFAQTLRKIAEDGESAFYDGALTDNIVADIQDHGGIITADDLRTATAPWVTPVSMQFNNGDFTAYSLPPPSSGIVVNFILKILDGYNFNKEDIKDMDATILSYHRMAEAMKFGFGKRSSLGDEAEVDLTNVKREMLNVTVAEAYRKKIKDDRTMGLDYYEPNFSIVNDAGTTHLSIVDSEGNAVSVTSTINTYFGSGVMGSRTGIIFNNEMDDFSTPGTVNYFGVPASESNFIKPGKRPMSSMSPAILVDKNKDVSLVVGASGGPRIINSIIQNIVRDLWFGQDLKTATDLPRIHNQLLPEDTFYEESTSQELLDGLTKLGHKVTQRNSEIGTIQAVKLLCPPCKNCAQKCVQAISDGRKGGRPFGY